MPSPIFLSKPSSGFTLAAVVRGAQLAFVGTYRALQNPNLAKHGYYEKAVKAAGISLLFELAFRLICLIIKSLLQLFASPDAVSDLYWVSDHVLQLRQVLLFSLKDSAMMDDLFLMSLVHVDHTNTVKHPDNDRLYGRLCDFQRHSSPFKGRKTLLNDIIRKFGKRMRISLTTWALSELPYIGRFITPLVAFQSFKNITGGPTALFIFGVGLFCPKHVFLTFLGVFWGTRSMMNDLLSPYFSRLPFSKRSKGLWYENRQGILFGFGAVFFMGTRIPYFGLFLYGLASASAAYLLTKVSDPIPKAHIAEWTDEQAVWTNEKQKER